MGNPLSGILSEVFIQYLEEKFIAKVMEKYSYLEYVCCVDESLIIIADSTRNTEEWILEEINTIHKNIRFAMEKEENSIINFLDLKIKRNPEELEFGTFRKETYTSNVISASSNHPVEHKLAAFRFSIDNIVYH